MGLPILRRQTTPAAGLGKSFTSGFVQNCEDPFGDVLYAEIFIRDNDDGSGGPKTLLSPVSVWGEVVVECNPILRRREIDFGTVEGGAWQIKLTNNTGNFRSYNLRGCWACIVGRFPLAIATFAQGKISRVVYSSDGTVTLEISDAISDLLNYSLTRDMRFQSSGWLSDMRPDVKSAGSDSYDSAFLIGVNPADYNDETFIVEFTTATTFKVILEDGDDSQTGNISTNLSVDNVLGGTNVLIIGFGGWGATYQAGDRFVFYTSEARSTTTLTPIYMIQHLLDSVVGWTGYDVLSGSILPSAQYDATAWNNARAVYDDYGVYGITGNWSKGTSIVKMIEDILKVVHASLYPVASGQIGIFAVEPGSTVSVAFNGNPADGVVNIIDGYEDDDARDVATSVIYRHKTRGDGEDAEFQFDDPNARWLASAIPVVDIGWEVEAFAIKAAAQVYVFRFGGGVKKYSLNTTLAGAIAEIGEKVTITDDMMSVGGATANVSEIAVDIVNNQVNIVSAVDKALLADYFQLDVSMLDGTEGFW